jgi:hypothetical protein
MTPRTKFFGLAFLVASCALLVSQVLGNWGKITIHADDKPVAEVVKSIERQGGVKILNAMEADAKISMHVDKVSLPEALDTLSIRSDGRLELAYLIAPTKSAITQLTQAVSTRKRESYDVARFGGMMAGGIFSDTPTDSRKMLWTPQPANPADLKTYLRQASLDTDASFYTPKDWNPSVPKQPSKGEISKSIESLASGAKARVEELYVLNAGRRDGGRGGEGGDRPERNNEQQGQQPQEWRGGFADLFNPETIAALERRAENQINLLPPDERPDAKAEFDRMRNMWKEMAALPPEQRGEKIREMMANPENQQRMEERMNNRDMRSTPEKRRDRYERGVDRKFQTKYGGGGGPAQGAPR